jgi:hypothetical protein
VVKARRQSAWAHTPQSRRATVCVAFVDGYGQALGKDLLTRSRAYSDPLSPYPLMKALGTGSSIRPIFRSISLRHV